MLLFAVLACLTYPDISLSPQLSKKQVQEEFYQAKESYWDRWEEFCQGKKFIPFEKEKSDEVLKQEFSQIQDVRHKVWFINPMDNIRESSYGYDVARPLLFEDRSRARNCMAFSYNNTCSYYNASTMDVGPFFCIACEGPRSSEVPTFFQMLFSYHVTHLVRLTEEKEGETQKCYPYWKDLFDKDHSILRIPVASQVDYPVKYYAIESWQDHHGIDPKKLLDVVLEVKKDVQMKKGLLAVHCSAGVGRTGTFLAALSIVDAIDHEMPFSIEEIVYRLSLQRIYSVAKVAQYITLHRLAEEYLKRKER